MSGRVASVGTTQGRMLEVVRSPHHVQLHDAATPHVGWTLNTEQARELGQALSDAADAVEGKA